MKIECSWSNCQYNSFSISEEMKKEIFNGRLVIDGTGLCNCKETIHLSLENEEEFLICDNYIDGCKFDIK